MERSESIMWSAIISSFENLTPMLWVSQISGLIGLIVIGISYLFKKKAFLGIATLSYVFFILEQVFAGLYSNLIVTVVSLIRNALMFLILLRKNKSLPFYVVVILLGVMWTAEIVYMSVSHTFGVWDNYLPPAIVTMSTCTQNSKNEYVVKTGSALHETGFLIYYLVYNLPLSIFRQALLVVATVIGIILLIIHQHQDRKRKAEESL